MAYRAFALAAVLGAIMYRYVRAVALVCTCRIRRVFGASSQSRTHFNSIPVIGFYKSKCSQLTHRRLSRTATTDTTSHATDGRGIGYKCFAKSRTKNRALGCCRKSMRGYIRPAPTNFPFRWLAPAVTHDWQALLVGRRRHRSVSPTARITMTRPHFQLTSIGLSNGLLRDGK